MALSTACPADSGTAEPGTAEHGTADSARATLYVFEMSSFRLVRRLLKGSAVSLGEVLARTGIILTEALGLILPFAYLYHGALPAYEEPKWELDTGYSSSLAAPGFALFGNYNDAASAIFSDVFNASWTKCYFPQWSNDSAYACNTRFPNSSAQLESGSYGQPVYFAFNPTSTANAPAITYANGTNQLLLQAGPVSCTSLFAEFYRCR